MRWWDPLLSLPPNLHPQLLPPSNRNPSRSNFLVAHWRNLGFRKHSSSAGPPVGLLISISPLWLFMGARFNWCRQQKQSCHSHTERDGQRMKWEMLFTEMLSVGNFNVTSLHGHFLQMVTTCTFIYIYTGYLLSSTKLTFKQLWKHLIKKETNHTLLS